MPPRPGPIRTVWQTAFGVALALIIISGLAVPVLAASGALSLPKGDADGGDSIAQVVSSSNTAEGSIAAFVTVADSADSDADGVLDPQDNCPSVPNGTNEASVAGVGNQTNTDADNQAAGFRLGTGSPPPVLAGDSLGDACDSDDDNDGFSDADERAIYIVGTGSSQERTPCRTATVSDPWPPDLFGSGGLPDRTINFLDLNAMVPLLFSSPPGPPYSVRFDVFQPGGTINFQDLNTVVPFLFMSCQPPPG